MNTNTETLFHNTAVKVSDGEVYTVVIKSRRPFGTGFIYTGYMLGGPTAFETFYFSSQVDYRKR